MRKKGCSLNWLGFTLGYIASKASAQSNGFTSVFDGNVVNGRPFNITWERVWVGSVATINLTKYEPIPGGYNPLLEMLTNFAQLDGHLTWTPYWEDDKVLYKMFGTERDNVMKWEKGFESEPFRILSQGNPGTPSNTRKTITLPQSLILSNGVSSTSNSLTTITKAPSSEVSAAIPTATSISTTETLTASSLPSEGIPSNSNTLNRSAKIGIGFGATIGFLAFTFILAFFFFRYGKRVAIETTKRQDPQTSPPALRLDVTRPPSCRIETLQPFELWSPSEDDLERKGAELEGWTGNGLFDTERGRRAEIDGKEKPGSMNEGSNAKRKSDAGSWLLSWGRWVDRV